MTLSVYRAEADTHLPVTGIKLLVQKGPRLEDCSRFFPGQPIVNSLIIEGHEFSVPGGFRVGNERREPIVFYTSRGKQSQIIAIGVIDRVTRAIEIPEHLYKD